MLNVITIPVWAWVVSSIVCGFVLQRLGWMIFRWMIRSDGSPWAEEQCPLCLRPHDSEARRLQRQLHKMHENFARVQAENKTTRAENETLRAYCSRQRSGD